MKDDRIVFYESFTSDIRNNYFEYFDKNKADKIQESGSKFIQEYLSMDLYSDDRVFKNINWNYGKLKTNRFFKHSMVYRKKRRRASKTNNKVVSKKLDMYLMKCCIDKQIKKCRGAFDKNNDKYIINPIYRSVIPNHMLDRVKFDSNVDIEKMVELNTSYKPIRIEPKKPETIEVKTDPFSSKGILDIVKPTYGYYTGVLHP